MTDEPGDSALAAPVEPRPRRAAATTHDDVDLDAAETTGAGDDEVLRISSRSRPSPVMLLLGAILVVALANVVVVWLLLGATDQVRDQSTVANGLQRCIIHAQLNENNTTDPNGTAYKAAVQACVNK